jgi:ATP-dependent 26S proteasome regulatory subunit
MLDILKLSEVLSTFEVGPLDDAANIEDLLVIINSLNDKEDFYKRLKKKRVSDIDTEMDKLDSKRQRLKEIIRLTLEKENRKTLNFPGVGKVTAKVTKGTWVIDETDDEKFIQTLKDNLSKEDLENVLETRMKIVKSNLNKVLDAMQKQVPGVHKDPDKPNLSVTFDLNVKEYEGEDPGPSPVKTVINYDTIQI